MDAKQGDLSLLDHPIAQELLTSRIPARLAYIALDGTPRVVPVLGHWTGEEFVVGSWPDDPKVAALRRHPRVAVTIDTDHYPFHVLQLRGSAAVAIVAGMPPEATAAIARHLGEEAAHGLAAQMTALSPEQARIGVRPDWAGLLDFETRLPGGLARRLAATRH